MIITWYGEGGFKMQVGEKSILIDLPNKKNRTVVSRLKSDILLKTITAFPIKEDDKTSKFVVYGAGEYDVDGIKVQGFQLSDESEKDFFKTVYTVKFDDISIGILGVISGKLSSEIIENFEDIDILIAPGGGDPFISQKEIIALIKQLDPKIFIPSFYKVGEKSETKYEAIRPLLDEFNGGVDSVNNSEDGEVGVSGDGRIVIKKKDIDLIKKTKIVCLSN